MFNVIYYMYMNTTIQFMLTLTLTEFIICKLYVFSVIVIQSCVNLLYKCACIPHSSSLYFVFNRFYNVKCAAPDKIILKYNQSNGSYPWFTLGLKYYMSLCMQ